jgi:hypothetical protein
MLGFCKYGNERSSFIKSGNFQTTEMLSPFQVTLCYIYLANNLVEKAEGKRTLGRPKGAVKDNIRIDLKEMGGKVWTE